MKIIRLSTLLDFGGIESKMLNLSTYNDDNEWIFCAIGKGGIASAKIKLNKKEVVCFNYSYRIPSLKTIYKLYKYFKKLKPNVIHCSGSEANFHGIIAAKMAKVPLIIAEEIGIPSHSKKAIKVFNFIYKLADFVVGESQIVIENLKNQYQINHKKLRVVSNFTLFPIYENTTSNTENKEFNILSVSRLEVVKNIEGIIKVINQLTKENFKIKYTIVGDGSSKISLINLVKKLNLENIVEFVGFQNNPNYYYLQTDLFVLNSFSEGFSNSLLEAMYFKKPVISTNVGAASEIIIEGKNGWVVSVDNEIELHQKIKYCLLLDKKTRTEIGNNANEIVVKKFSLKSHVNTLLQLYNSKK